MRPAATRPALGRFAVAAVVVLWLAAPAQAQDASPMAKGPR